MNYEEALETLRDSLKSFHARCNSETPAKEAEAIGKLDTLVNGGSEYVYCATDGKGEVQTPGNGIRYRRNVVRTYKMIGRHNEIVGAYRPWKISKYRLVPEELSKEDWETIAKKGQTENG